MAPSAEFIPSEAEGLRTSQGRPHRRPFDPSAGSGQAGLPSTEFTLSRVEGLRTGRTGPQVRYKTIRESLTEAVQAPFHRAAKLLRGQA